MNHTTADDKSYLGECRRVTITSISEIGWHDTRQILADIQATGGPEASQWDKTWDPHNAAGSSSLIEVMSLNGEQHRFIVDCGWNEEYMARRFEETGVATMLQRGEIDFLFLSHEHLDHLWGLQTVLRLRPDITLRIPPTFTHEAMAFILGERAAPTHTGTKPRIKHTGTIIPTPPGKPTILYPGCVAVAFDLPIPLGIHGEQSLYFRVQNKGTVCVTGCCHQTVTRLADHALTHITNDTTLHGLYGGLHIAPFGPLSAEQGQMIADLRRFGFQKIAANHCTGPSAIEKMVELRYPVIPDNRGAITFG